MGQNPGVAHRALVQARNLAIYSIVLGCVSFVICIGYTYSFVTLLGTDQEGENPVLWAWVITATVAALPANVGCIAVCSTILALYDRSPYASSLGGWGGSAGTTIVRVVTEAEAQELRMGVRPYHVEGSVPGFDLVALPKRESVLKFR